MSYLTSPAFWTATAERAVKTFAQTLVAVLTASQASTIVGVDIANINWPTALSLSAGAALLSVLTSIASGPIGPAGSPSVVSSGSGSAAPREEMPTLRPPL